MLSKVHTNLPPHLSHRFINIYSNSGDLHRARQLFDTILERTWTVLISANTKHGFPEEAIKLYAILLQSSIKPDELVVMSFAKACASSGDLIQAKSIHVDAVRFGFCSDLLLGNALIDMYEKCRFFVGAQRVFDDMQVKDVIIWTSLPSCCANCGLPRQALIAFREMGLNGVRPNSATVSLILPACSGFKYLNSGREILGFVVKNGMGENVFVSSAHVDMYASCLSLQQAQLVFDKMSRRDIVS